MKTRSFIFSMSVAALLFAACSNDENYVREPGINGGGAQSVVEGEPTYASFSVKWGDDAKHTRATPAPGDLSKEDQIGDVTVLIFNYQTKVLENKFNIVPTGATVSGTYLITSGNKRIYAFANLNEKSGKTVIDGLKEKESTVDYMLGLMSNNGTDLGQTETHVPMATIDDGLPKPVKNGIEEGNADAENKIVLTMSRMIAKAKLTLNTGVEAKLKVKGFAVNNVPIATYIVQNAAGGAIKSPLYDKTWPKEDELFNSDIHVAAADFMAKETTYTNQTNTYYYLTENTSPSFLKGSATHFILNATYIPERIITDARFDVATQNLIFTYNNNPGVNECDTYCYVTETQEGKGNIIPAQVYFSTKQVLDAAIAAYNVGVKQDPDKVVDATKVKYNEYTTGSYYRINIGEGTGAENTVFGVKRNYAYNVTVNTVTGPGFNTPTGPNGAEGKPEEPIDQKTYLKVDISVTPWGTADQSVDIN